MYDSSSFANPTPLAHADTSRDVLPRGDGKLVVEYRGKSWRVQDHYKLKALKRKLASLPSGIVVSDADCCAVGPGFESRRRHGLALHKIPYVLEESWSVMYPPDTTGQIFKQRDLELKERAFSRTPNSAPMSDLLHNFGS
ncbi:hypothetical protein TNCV_3226821 [Trichonephila clavipes]|nr:hypothetical protein TNCV_3226821 [Trichonephila clavipes]